MKLAPSAMAGAFSAVSWTLLWPLGAWLFTAAVTAGANALCRAAAHAASPSAVDAVASAPPFLQDRACIPSESDIEMSATEIIVGQLRIRYLVDGSQSASLGMFELTVPPGSNVPPPHSHSNNEEIVYVVEGKLRYTVGAETRDLLPGETMRTPKGTVHGFANPFGSVARALITLAPDVGPGYFEDVAAVINAGGPPDKAALAAAMARYGLVPAAPK